MNRNYKFQNPVEVAEPVHYLYSSAIDYAGAKGLLNVYLMTQCCECDHQAKHGGNRGPTNIKKM
ncbi:MAG: hypothetical protein ACI9XJ_000651 [Marivirga sp.]|jgi:hypothetical protein